VVERAAGAFRSIVPGWEKVLHNQRAVYIKRLLLFERNVLLTSVPYHLP
jgi:hypothetical protein